MSTYDKRILIYDAIKDRIEAMIDDNSQKLFDKVEYGRRGTMDTNEAGCHILPAPRSDIPVEKEFQKEWRQWNYQIFIDYFGEDEYATFDKIEFLAYSVRDLFMEKPEPPEGYGYNRTLNMSNTKVDIGDVYVVGVEDKGYKQIAIIHMAIEVRI